MGVNGYCYGCSYSGEWETRKGEAEREGDPGLIWCVIYVE